MSNLNFSPALKLETATERLVDDIGALRAEVADRQARLKELENYLRESGPGTYEGRMFRITVSVSERATVAWKAIAEKLGASRQMVKGNTQTSEVTTLRCTARLKSVK